MSFYSHRLISRTFGLAFAGAVLVACNTQQPPANQAQAPSVPPGAAAVCAQVTSDAPASLQKKPGYQQVAISVTDASGREVQNLSKDDFVVKLGDEQLPVQFAEDVPNGPASVLILADTSGSTLAKLPQTREAITQVVNNLDPRDDVALYAFSSKPFNLQPFTRDHSAIIEQEKLLHSYGSTSLFDSVHAATDMLQRGCYPARVLVVISDGIDNTSGRSRDDMIDDLRSRGVSIYAIAIGRTNAGDAGLFASVYAPSQDTESLNERSLGLLTNPAGGSTFKVDETGDQDLLAAAANSIMEGSRAQYVVGFIDPTKTDSTAVTTQIKNHEEYSVFGQRPLPVASATAN